MNTIIIDNESKIVEGLEMMLQAFVPEVKVSASAATVKDAVRLIQKYEPELVFLDIELNDGTGIDVLKQLGEYDFKIIFITAYDKYAIEVFKYSAIDFLLKPIDPDDLVEAVSRAKKAIKKEHSKIQINTFFENMSQVSLQNKKIIISDKNNIYALPVKDILYLEADGAYTKFVLENQDVVSSKNLKTYEGMLSDAGFFRTHHSFLVNLAHMVRFNKVEGTLILGNGQQVAVSFRKKEALVERIKNISFL